MDKIAILPLFGSIFLLMRGSDARQIFVFYFLPVLTLIPAYFETKLVSGIPELTFWSSALIPLIFVWFVKEQRIGYQFSWLDVIVILHLLFIFYAQFEATGYKDAQKILFREILSRLIPYMFLKSIIMDKERRVPALKVITYLGAFVTVFMVYDFLFYHNLIDDFIRRVWSQNVPWGGTLQRFGFKRAAGSFAHPISAGYFYSLATPIAFWLWHSGYFKNKKIGFIITGMNALGAITSISRAPIAGLLLGILIVWFGWSQHKAISGGILTIMFVVGLAMVIPKFVEYVSIDRAHAKTQDQENAAYRKEMLDNYIEVVKKKPNWGYGRYSYPIINGQKSIDNEYLFIAITSGMNTLIMYIILIVWVLVRLLKFVFTSSYDDPSSRLAWVLLAAWLSALFTQATVYSGMQTTHYFYMVAAAAEALVLNKSLGIVTTEVNDSSETLGDNYGYHFSRTL